MIQRVVISAPFGNWFRYSGASSTLGTFTLKDRGGLLWRAWRMAASLRYSRRTQSWINKLGLPNPGVESLADVAVEENDLVSIHGFDSAEWVALVGAVIRHQRIHRGPGGRFNPAIEFNFSCPNVGHKPSIAEAAAGIDAALIAGAEVVAKLPPIRWMDYVIPLYGAGVRSFHLCNTIPTPGGGWSGAPLKQYSLWAVEEVRQKFGGDVYIIGGGGVSCVADGRDYRIAGANSVAVASHLLNPLNWRSAQALVNDLSTAMIFSAPAAAQSVVATTTPRPQAQPQRT